MRRSAIGLGCLALALLLSPPALAAPAWLAPQTISVSGEDANYSQVATDPQGNAIVVWQSIEGGSWTARATTRTAGGSWSAPASISASGQSVYALQVAVDGAGNAIAVWQVLDGDYFNYAIQATTRPAGGGWSAPVNLSPAGENSELAQVSVNARGDAAVVWERFEAGQRIARAVTRPAGGIWSAPVSLSAAGPVSLHPQVAVDGAGDAAVVWERYDGSNFRIEAATRPAGGGWSAPVSLSAAGQSGAEPDVAAGLEGDTVATWRRRNNGTLWVAQAATHSLAGGWSPPANLSAMDDDVRFPRVSSDDRGGATVVWERVTGGDHITQAATHSPGGGWSAPASLSAAGQPAYFPQIAGNGAGAAVVVWYRYDGSVYVAQAATHSPGGGWSVPANLSAAGEDAYNPKVAVDSEGNAVAVWERPDGSSNVIQGAGYDAAGPQLRNLSIPTRGRAGVPIPFSVSPLDIWSGLGGTTWSFGDGAASTGTGVEHVYARSGTYKATVTAADSLGNPTTAAATIAIVAGRAYAARLAEVRRGRARLKLRCREGNCAGFVKLSARKVPRRPGRGAKIRRVALGGSSFAIANGEAKIVAVKLGGRAGKLIRSAGKKRLRVRLGGSGVMGRAVRLKPTAKSRRGHRSRRNDNRSGGKRWAFSTR